MAKRNASSELVRDLIREERDREKLRNLLLEGAASPLDGPADDAWFEGLRSHAVKHAKK